MIERAQLELWITQTERNQRRLRTAIIPAAVVAVGVLVVNRPAGVMAILSVMIVAVFGFWIMASHIADWTAKLDALDRPKPVPGTRTRREPD